MAIGDDYDKGVKFANKVLGPDGMGRYRTGDFAAAT